MGHVDTLGSAACHDAGAAVGDDPAAGGIETNPFRDRTT
jgi:hypothetical protein